MNISATTKEEIRSTAGNAGDASGNADRARWAADHDDKEVAKQSLEWCLEQANLTVFYARRALQMLNQESPLGLDYFPGHAP